MSAIACVRNPAKPEDTLVFFCTTDQNVGFSIVPDKVDGGLRDGEDDDEVDVPLRGLPVNTGETKVGTLVAQPGAFCSLVFDNLIRVYGVRSTGDISLLSPGVSDLPKGPSTAKRALAGCGDGEGQAWLYYLGDDNDPPKLTQYTLSDFADKAFSTSTAHPDPQTSLSAYYKASDGSRACVFQDNGSTKLRYIEVLANASEPSGDVDGTGYAAAKTPIATAVIKDTVFLYYVDQDNVLQRVVRKGRAGWTDTNKAQGNTWNLYPLTAVPSLDGNSITIRQVGRKNAGIIPWTDNVTGIAI
ncbi:hypothetical protein DFH27DRAFT_535044 [Peziza echinospora]|nr:hypothetical protein DFH27DRAFT_535044 [Peziza echinospora]